ncbi:hypothetical protein JCM10213v2_002719 [Rhodosporidiobolus nylandii]
MSLRRLLKAIEVADEGNDGTEKHQWSNLDLVPTPKEERIWTKWTYIGLSPIIAWVTLATSHALITILIVLNGRASSRYHIGYPVFSRAVFGMYGSYMAVFMRAVVCIIWQGTNGYYGGRLVNVALTAIFPQWRNLPNILAADAGITSTNLASFFIFQLVQVSMSVVHARDLKYFYQAKSVLVFIAMHAIMIWWMLKAGGAQFGQFASKEMSQTSYLWLAAQSFNAGLGTASSLTVNQGDMTRYADKPSSAIWTTLIGFPIASALPCLYGILVASAAKKITGTAYWNLWDTLDYMLQQYPHNHGARFGIFLAAGALALAYIGVNLATNALPFGSDLTALFPCYFTIRRGQFLCCILGIAIVPWKILTSAQVFITFLSGYGYWLAPLAGCLAADYYVVAKGNVELSQLYTSDPNGRYWYAKGWNWRAVAATLLALLPCLPGFAQQLTKNDLGVSLVGRRLFYISFVLTYVLSVVLYLGFTYLVPRRYTKEHNLIAQGWEQLANELDAKEAADEQLAAAEEASEDDKPEGGKEDEVEGIAYVVPVRAELR